MSKVRSNQEWEEDYDETTYDKQYADDDASDGVQLNFNTLYVTNIPKVMTREGLQNAFRKYGTVVRTFLSYDPQKRYALITYESPNEAKVAMMKLNKAEPLNLNVNVSHSTLNKKFASSSNDNQEKRPRDNTQRDRGSYRDESGSVGSYGKYKKTKEEVVMATVDNDYDDDVEEDLGLEMSLDPDLHLELERLKLEHLKLQEAQVQCKQRMLLLNSKKPSTNMTSSVNRSILPDGRIVVRNNYDKNADVDVGAGAGDSLTIPALQRVASNSCVVCGARAEMYCGRCELTPYCGPPCQRSDWATRHQNVCHNLQRLSKPKKPESNTEPEVVSIPPAAPLRKPHSPARPGPKRDQGPSNNQKYGQPNGESSSAQHNSRGPRNFNNNNNNNKNNYQNRTPESKPSSQQNSRPNTRYPRRPDQDQIPDSKEPPCPEVKVTPEVKPEPVKVPVKIESPVKTQAPAKAEVPVKTPKPLPQVSDTTPVRKIVPTKYLLETLSIGDFVMLSVEAAASECNSKQAGHVCLSLHVDSEAAYQSLCGPFGDLCAREADTTPAPGDTFSYLDASEEAWYRARCLSAAAAALIDSCRVVALPATAKALPAHFADVPEFCCVLHAAKGLTPGQNYKATILAKTASGYKVALEDETGAPYGEGEACRWLPEVEYPKPAPAPAAGTAPKIPDVDRPDVVNNSKVFLVHATAVDAVLVRPADKASMMKYDSILQDVVLYGMSATPLSEPPQAGQTVIAKFTDGLHYRALCRRTNVKLDKYLLQYIEFGNSEVAQLKNLYPCPPELTLEASRTQVSLVKLQTAAATLTPPATDYLTQLSEDSEELLLTIPSGAKTAPSGSEVCLSLVKNNESVNKKITEMCTPEWKKIEERGGDVLETEVIMEDQITYLSPPEGDCIMDVLDTSTLSIGTLSARVRGTSHVETVLGPLTERMAEYCNSEIGKEPYLPKLMEACICQRPPHKEWYRAVLLEHKPGSPEASVCLIDYGNIEAVPVRLLRKMLPEFVRGLPALALQLEIKDFPVEPTPAQLARAQRYMEVDDEGRGTLHVRRCEKRSPGFYAVTAPLLIAAIRD